MSVLCPLARLDACTKGQKGSARFLSRPSKDAKNAKFYAESNGWVERNLLILKCIDTTVNESDHFTKPLQRVLFHRHIDRIMGHMPPE